jgi:CRP/FNR family transcriptional regulator
MAQNVHTDCNSLLLRQLSPLAGGAQLWNTPASEALREAHGRHRFLEAGQALFHVATPLVNLFLVASGSLKSVASDEDGNDQVMVFHFPGEILGMDALGHDIHRVTAIALEDTEICEINSQRLRTGARSMGRDQDHLELLGRRQALERLSVFLHLLAERRQRLGLPHEHFRLSMSRQDIASYLGLVIETVSRCFTVLQEEGVIHVNGRDLHILQPARLGLAPAKCGLPDLDRRRR